MQSHRSLKAVVGTLQSNRRLSRQICKLPYVPHVSIAARNDFQILRFFCNSSKGGSVNEKKPKPSTAGNDGAEPPNEAMKEPNGAENVKSAKPEAAGDTKAAAADCRTGSSEDVKPDPNADLKNLLKEKQAMVKEKDKVLLQAKQQVLTCLAEIENVRGRTRRDAESLKKHAVETFATELLDMADTLGRAGAAIPESVQAEALPADASGNAKLLKSLFEGVDMTQKQLMKIFNKFGVQRFDPVGQRFDPNHHLAIVEVEDESKEPQSIVNVVKPGYLFNNKVIRPAEVGIVKKRAEAQPQS